MMDNSRFVPRAIRVALDDMPAENLLGYRFVIQYEEELGDRTTPLMDEEIRLVDGMDSFQFGYGPGFDNLRDSTDIFSYWFEHAYIQLYLSGEWQNEYRLVDILGSDRNADDEAYACREWLRNWIGAHQDAGKIPDREEVVKKLQASGRRIPFKIHIWYADVWDPERHFRTKRVARGHQDMWVWVSESTLEELRKGLLRGETGPYHHILPQSMSFSAKMQMDDTLQMDCDRHLIEGEWAEGEKERLTGEIRFLMEDDVNLLRHRLKEKGVDITPDALFEGLENTYAWRRTWSRDTGHSWDELYLLKGGASKTDDDSWDWNDTPVRLADLSVKSIVYMLDRIDSKDRP